jgi:hypothetical protein
MAAKNGSTWRKTCPTATLSTTNPTWTDLKLMFIIVGFIPYRAVNTLHLGYENQSVNVV